MAGTWLHWGVEKPALGLLLLPANAQFPRLPTRPLCTRLLGSSAFSHAQLVPFRLWVAATGKRDDWLNSLPNIPHHQGHLKLDCTRFLRTSCQKQPVLAETSQTPAPPTSRWHFILDPLFTLFANISACPARLVALPQGRLALVEDNMMSSAVQCQQKDVPAPRFKAGWVSPGQHCLSSLARDLGQPKDMKHVLKEVIVLEEEIAHYLPMGAQGQGEKRPYACQILLFVMM